MLIDVENVLLELSLFSLFSSLTSLEMVIVTTEVIYHVLTSGAPSLRLLWRPMAASHRLLLPSRGKKLRQGKDQLQCILPIPHNFNNIARLCSWSIFRRFPLRISNEKQKSPNDSFRWALQWFNISHYDILTSFEVGFCSHSDTVSLNKGGEQIKFWEDIEKIYVFKCRYVNET